MRSYLRNSQLQKKCQTETKRQGLRLKVVEKAGVAIKRLLQKSDTFKPQQCEREDCPVCRTEGKGACNRESVTYELNVSGVTTSTFEKRQGARIPEGKNTQSHSAIKRNDRPCGNIAEGNTVMRYSNFK